MANQPNLVLSPGTPLLHRHNFPPGFVFGTSSSAYQYEGAVENRGKNIWDSFTRIPGKIKDGSNGDIAVDSYHKFEEDVACMKRMGVDAYGFSISWSRILRGGNLSEGVSSEGIKYYKNLIKKLLDNGIEPVVTLFHWDLPQPLENAYGGFLSHKIVADFCIYADFCFKTFGDQVKNWVTLNEPSCYSSGGYATGSLAPGRGASAQGHATVSLAPGHVSSLPRHSNMGIIPPTWGRYTSWQPSCNNGGDKGIELGDSGTEPYLVTHHQLLAHAAAVKLYREKYQASQKGKIGIKLMVVWMEPLTESKGNRDAALRALDFLYGWFMDPLTNGDYPHSMRTRVGNRLPKFSSIESMMVKGSFDFIGLDYYTARYAANEPNCTGKPSYLTDSGAQLLTERNGIPIGPKAGSDWLYVYEKGIWDILLYTKRKYNNPLVYVTENGVDEANEPTLSLPQACIDIHRIDFHYKHLCFVKRAIEDGANVKGYFAWSLMDNFEWSEGFTVRFGINYVDFKNGLKRYPKLSSVWFNVLLKK
ncbi:beta-glucosidase 24-like [Cornus florida]|uniref:beta-glucosidase 24-like n=1 Tax=Cornus florida TaxID=4283 RepID=UPI0028A0B424|nr:beta-glucosidase 24-like [Cornus florida]